MSLQALLTELSMGMDRNRYWEMLTIVTLKGAGVRAAKGVYMDYISGNFRLYDLIGFYEWVKETGYWSQEELAMLEVRATLEMMG